MSTGSTGTYTIQTTNPSDVEIDSDVAVSADTITAPANITIDSAYITDDDTVTVTFNDPGDDLASVDFSKWHIDVGDGGATPFNPVSASVVSSTSWTIALTFASASFDVDTTYAAANGLYVDAMGVTDTNGDTNAIVTHDFSVAILDGQFPETPDLVSPLDDAIVGTEVELDWNAAAGAAGYTALVDDDPGFGSFNDIFSGGSTTFTTDPLAPGLYYWKVQANDANLNSSGFSETRTFTVTDVAADITFSDAQITAHDTVTVTFNNPGDDLASVDFSKWHIDEGDGGATPLNPVSASIASASAWIIELTFASGSFGLDDSYDAANGLYVDADGVTDTSDDTNTVVADGDSIAIDDAQPPPYPPTLYAPFDGATVADPNVTGNQPVFDWSYPPTADNYDIEIDDNDDFSSIYFSTNVSESTYTGFSCCAIGTYYWHVNARDVNGNATDFSETFSFTVTDVPPAEVFVDDDYTAKNAAEVGRTLFYDAFTYIPDAIEWVADGATVNVASGSYVSSEPIEIDKEIDLIGPGIDVVDPLDRAYIEKDFCEFSPTASTMSISANNSYVGGLFISLTDGGDDCHANPVIRVLGDDAQIVGNDITGGKYGIAIRGSLDTTISNNVLHDNETSGINNSSGKDTTITENEIYDNGIGIQLQAGGGGCLECDGDFGSSSINFNDIHNNGTGLYADNSLDTSGIVFENNKIYGNDEGMNTDGSFDARNNWWGDSTGPQPLGLGDSVNSVNGVVLHRPFWTDEDMTTLSESETEGDDMGALFDSGSWDTGDDDADNTEQVNVNEDTTIAAGDSSVFIEEGTIITATGGGNFDSGDISMEELLVGDVTGLDGVEGVLQWGIVDFGLTFSNPITVSIFVGADLNGTTLTIQRSTSGTGGWTDDGIEPPATCVVAAGLCTFEATQASYYAATSSGGGGGGGGGYIPPFATPTPTSMPLPATVGDPANLARYNLREGDVVRAPSADDPDVYIVNEWGYKRLFLNPIIFNFYAHLGWSKVRSIIPVGRDAFPTSGLFRNCENNDQRVFAVEVTAEDSGTLHHVQISGDAAVAQDPDFFKKVFCINNNEFNWYLKGTDYASLSQIPEYRRQTFAPAPVLHSVKVVSTTPYLNVRNSPSLTGTLIGRLMPGEVVNYTQISNGWYEIQQKNSVWGWVSGKYVTVVK